MLLPRCVKDIFGYCKKGMVGEQQSTPDGKITFTGSTGTCLESAAACQYYVSNTEANPYCPELEKSELKTKIIPPEPTKPKKKEKPPKQGSLINEVKDEVSTQQ